MWSTKGVDSPATCCAFSESTIRDEASVVHIIHLSWYFHVTPETEILLWFAYSVLVYLIPEVCNFKGEAWNAARISEREGGAAQHRTANKVRWSVVVLIR